MSSKKCRYEDFRNEMKDGDVLLFRGTGPMSALIRWKTRSPYSHAGIVAWWNDRLMVLEAVGKGVIARPISYNLKKYHGDIDYFRSTEELDEKTRRRMVSFAQKQLGKEYNMKQLIKFAFKLLFGLKLKQSDDPRSVSRYFCSHYVADIYARHGYDLARKRSDRYTSPELLANSDKLEFVGTLKSFDE